MFSNEILAPSNSTAALARRIQELGIGPSTRCMWQFADESGADVFLTTDDDLCAGPGGIDACFAFESRTRYFRLREVQA